MINKNLILNQVSAKFRLLNIFSSSKLTFAQLKLIYTTYLGKVISMQDFQYLFKKTDEQCSGVLEDNFKESES